MDRVTALMERRTGTKSSILRSSLLILCLVLCLEWSVLAKAAAAAPETNIFLEKFLYYMTDDKIILDFRVNEPISYTMRYAEASNRIIVELPGIDGGNFHMDVEVDDSTLSRIEIGPLTEHERGGVRVVLFLWHKVPGPLAFRVSRGCRLLVEIEKEFHDGFETFVAPGLAYGHWRKDTPSGPLFVNYMKIDLRQPGIEVRPVMAANGKETVHELAAQHGAIAGVNGIYFAADGRPLGLLVIDGQLVSPPYFNRTAAGIWPDGSCRIDNVTITGEVRVCAPVVGDSDQIGLAGTWSAEESAPCDRIWQIDGVNRLRYADELIVYTPENGAATRTNNYGWEIIVKDNRVLGWAEGNSLIPQNGYVLSGHGKAAQWLRNLEIGDYIDAKWGMQPAWLEQGVAHAVGGGPRLLRGGELAITAEEERFQPDITRGRAPRTALGITASGELLLMTVNGRQDNISIGMTLEELAELMLNLGAVEAMNLDGGGSSTMVVRGIVLNAPSDGKPRPVNNALLVWADTR
ncbi:MAG: phosphodiester glycosidase family protein [Firmicutes bacterium]|nr:phosphodiester glycosidase family protein [Bacillota bacterium]